MRLGTTWHRAQQRMRMDAWPVHVRSRVRSLERRGWERVNHKRGAAAERPHAGQQPRTQIEVRIVGPKREVCQWQMARTQSTRSVIARVQGCTPALQVSAAAVCASAIKAEWGSGEHGRHAATREGARAFGMTPSQPAPGEPTSSSGICRCDPVSPSPSTQNPRPHGNARTRSSVAG